MSVIYCPTRFALGSPFFSPDMIRFAKQLIPSFDIVNLQTMWGYGTKPLSNICVNSGVPYYISLRGQYMDYAMKQVDIIKRIKKKLFLSLVGFDYLNNASAFHSTSEMEADQLKSYPITTPIFIIPNCVEIEDFNKPTRKGIFRGEFRIPENALVLILVGRLQEKKNPEIAVSALIEAQKLQSDVHLLIVGPDEENFKQKLYQQAQDANCEGKLHFTGLLETEKLRSALSDSDLILMPSDDENFGRSAAEAMAAGLPILTYTGVPVGYCAKEGGAGEIVSLDNKVFSEKTMELLSNPYLLKKMGEKGKILARDLFAADVVAEKMLSKLEEIVVGYEKQ